MGTEQVLNVEPASVNLGKRVQLGWILMIRSRGAVEQKVRVEQRREGGV